MNKAAHNDTYKLINILRSEGLVFESPRQRQAAFGIVGAHLSRNLRERMPIQETANALLADLEQVAGVYICSTLRAHLAQRICDYLRPEGTPFPEQLYWDVCQADRTAPLPFYTLAGVDPLVESWEGKRIWMNPANDDQLPAWIKKAAKGEANICVGYIPVRPLAGSWKHLISANDNTQVRIPPRDIERHLHNTDSCRRVFVVFLRAR